MNETKTRKYEGVYCPAVTPFDERGDIDLAAAGNLYDHLIAGGIDGIVILGSIGEFQTVTMQAKHRLIDFAVSHIADRCALIVGTGGTVISEVIELTNYAREAGADAAMIIPPYYAPLTPEAILNHYAAVATAVDFDILLYNFPWRTGYDIPASVVRDLAETHGNIVGIKDTVDTMSHTREVINAVLPVRPEFSVLSGFDEYLYPNVLAGGAGTVNGLTNLVPAVFRRGFDAYSRGDLATMQETQRTVGRLMALYSAGPNFVATFKYAATLFVPQLRPFCGPPEQTLPADTQKAVRELLAELGIHAAAR